MMKPSQLVYLKKELNREKERIYRINELLKNKDVIEFLKLNGLSMQSLIADEWEILTKILENYEINQTNGIYVCTGAYYEYCNICYQETNYYTYPTDLFSELAEYRVYKDIESGVIKHAYLSLKDCDCQAILTKDFESKNIVLNPYGTYKNKNGYDEVRKLFFLEAIKDGQPKAKQLVLSKFNKM